MKVKQIVGEHKKGVRAKIYTKKPQNTIAPAKPKKPEGPVSEDAKITKSDTTGVEITADDGVKTTLPPEKAAALTPDPSNPNEYDLNPNATSPTGDTPTGPKVGANVEIKTAEAASDDWSTMPTTEFVKGIYAAAAENGMDAPEAEAVKKQMVLAPNGEVDIIATMQKAAQVFQSPEFKQLLADLDVLVKRAEANPELARIQELSGMTDEDVRLGDFTQHDNGDTSYSAGPLSVRKSKDGSTDMTATIGDTTARIQQNPIGVRTMTAQGSAADAISSVDASAERKGVDPTKFDQFKKQAGVSESAELTAMLKIAGLR